jgi:PAS domain S-box-containing protein
MNGPAQRADTEEGDPGGSPFGAGRPDPGSAARAHRLAERLARYEALTAALSYALLPAELARVVVGEGLGFLGARRGWVWTLSRSGDELELLHGSGLSEEQTAAFARVPCSLPGPGADAVRRREPVWLESRAELEARYPEVALSPGTGPGLAGAYLPLMYDNQPLGVLAFGFDEAFPFDTGDRAHLVSLARQCAQALARALLFEQNRLLSHAVEQGRLHREAQEAPHAGVGLVEGRLLFERIAATSPDTLFVHDLAERRLVYANRDLLAITGVAPEQVAAGDAQFYELALHPEDRDVVRAVGARYVALRDGEVDEHEVRYRCADGTYRRLRTRAVVLLREADGRVRQILGIAQDVTEQRRAEEALRESEALYRTLCEAVPDFVWTADANGEVTFANQRWREYTGVSLAQVNTAAEERLIHAEDRPALEARWAVAIARGEPFEAEYRYRRRDGVFRWFLHRSVPFKDEAGRIVRWVGTSTDIEDRKRAEKALRDADRRKDEFLAMLSHELRNPLSAISTATEVLKLRGADRPEIQRPTDVIRRQSKHLTRLVDDLTEVSRITRGKIELQIERVDMQTVAARAIETVRPAVDARRQVLTVTFPDPPVHLDADPIRLIQVLGNLLSNASKYTPEGGRIELTLESIGQEAMLRVRDTGEGIPAEMLARIFDLFIQVDTSLHRARGGLGIGLTLARTLVEMHGGSLEAWSEGPGHGSEFVVRLPALAGAPCDAVQSERTSVLERIAPHRILCVDDNRDAAETMAALLTATGHDVQLAHDGVAALEAVRGACPEVVLLDLGLPTMDGYEVARCLRAEHPDLILVALTGYGTAADRARSRQAGFNLHLVKPVEPRALATLLRSLPQATSGRS